MDKQMPYIKKKIISYPDKERDLDLEGEREADPEGDLAGDRREDLPFGDLLHED